MTWDNHFGGEHGLLHNMASNDKGFATLNKTQVLNFKIVQAPLTILSSGEDFASFEIWKSITNAPYPDYNETILY